MRNKKTQNKMYVIRFWYLCGSDKEKKTNCRIMIPMISLLTFVSRCHKMGNVVEVTENELNIGGCFYHSW